MTESRRPPTGCAMFGIYSGMFWRRRSNSMSSLSRIKGAPPATAESGHEAAALSAPANPAHRKGGVHDDSSLTRRKDVVPLPAPNNAMQRVHPPAGSSVVNTTKTVNGGAKTAAGAAAAEYTGMAAELDKMIHDHQRVKGTTQLVRATSGNMMLHRNLGNLNAGVPGASSARNSLDRNPKEANQRKPSNGYAFSGLGNIVKEAKAPPAELCRALSHRTDPEKLKEMGNEEYREGHYAEAVALYDQAIMVDPRRPAYWSNKAAALAALGRLIEAVGDCREAVRIDPSFGRAHHRLGGLYLRKVEAGLKKYKPEEVAKRVVLAEQFLLRPKLEGRRRRMYLITSNLSSPAATVKRRHNGNRRATAVFGDQRRRCSAISVSCYGQSSVFGDQRRRCSAISVSCYGQCAGAQLRKHIDATLGSGNLREAVRLPPGEDINEWLAVNTVDFFNQVNLLYGTLTAREFETTVYIAEYTELKMSDINRHSEPRKTRTRRCMYLIRQRVMSGGNDRTTTQRGQACNVCGRRSAAATAAVFGYQRRQWLAIREVYVPDSATCHERRQRPNNGTTGAGMQRLWSAISGSNGGGVRR
ncbi:hypothetical protein GUJ93_ZPchr0002g23329, partial [Zizania palustris]